MYIYSALKTLQKLVSNLGTGRGSFYALHPARVAASVALWNKELPGVVPYYAVKCNPEPQLLNILYDKGINFDCASQKEILQVEQLARGPISNRIIYANPCKSESGIAAAISVGTPTTVVDSVEELKKIPGFAALIRIAVDDSRSAMPFSSKFGCPWHHVERIGAYAKEARIPIHGISFHVGSGGGGAWRSAIESAYQCILNLREKSAGGHAPYVIDIGGGFVPHPCAFVKAASEIREAIRVVSTQDSLTWIAEPGRYFAGNSFDFFVKVIGKKKAGQEWRYTIDDSLYGQFSCILFDRATPLWARVGEGRRPLGAGTIFGRTCDSVDVIARAAVMEELEVGDWLWFPRMGAYTRATASEFNGFPAPPVFQVDYEEPIVEFPSGVRRLLPVTPETIWT